MGMFDNINVKENNIKLPLPKTGYYQTKWLDSNLCEIDMDADGLMTCQKPEGCEHYPVEDCLLIANGAYNGELHFHGDAVDGKWYEFSAEVTDSRITKLWSYGDLLFDANTHPEIDAEFNTLPETW